jgi:hypothetical protein
MTSGVAENSVLFGGRVKPEAPTQEIERVWLPTASTLHNSRYKPLRDLHNAFSVMPGLVPGIHVVTRFAGCRTSSLSAAAPDVSVLDLN